MISRRARSMLELRLRQMPAVILLGPRQVGKTTLARSLVARRKASAIYLDLERPVDARRLEDPDAFLRAQTGKLVVIDEIHRAPSLFDTLRGIIDDRRAAGDRAGHFLLLGSASIGLMRRRRKHLPAAPRTSTSRPSMRWSFRAGSGTSIACGCVAGFLRACSRPMTRTA